MIPIRLIIRTQMMKSKRSSLGSLFSTQLARSTVPSIGGNPGLAIGLSRTTPLSPGWVVGRIEYYGVLDYVWAHLS